MLQSPVDHADPSGNLSNAREEVNRFTKLLMRTKTIASQRSYEDGDAGSEPDQVEGHLQKVLTTPDLISLGVGSCCGTGMYVVAGFVARTIAGPAVIVSFIIAAIASILSGVCYGEFGVRVPKTTGSAYMYSYVAVGEFVAFLLGWNMILEYVIGSAAGASAISYCFDALTNHTMSTYLEENVGTVIGKSYPDFVGCFVCLLMTGILAAGVRGSVRFNNILNSVNFIVWIFIVIAGLFYVRADNWTLYGFAPNGASGVFTGAATCFYAFIGFDIIGTTGEEAKNPSRSIPIAIVSSLFICLLAYVSVSVILTLMIPYYDVEPGSALVDMFVQRGFYSAKWIVAVGALAALVVSLLGSMFPMPRIIYAMTRDGLLFEFLGRIHQRTGTPLVATVLTGTLASLMSLLVSLEILIEMMSIGTLLAYSLVSISVLILRYQPDKHDLPIPLAHRTDPDTDEATSAPSSSPSYGYDDEYTLPGASTPSFDSHTAKRRYKDDQHLIPTASDESRSYGSVLGASRGSQCIESKAAVVRRHAKIWWLRLGFPGDDVRPTDRTARTVILFTGLLCIAELGACVVIVFGGWMIEAGQAWIVAPLVLFIAAAVACVVVILRQPQNKCHVDFKAPAVPLLPSVAVFVNLYLALNLPALTWMRLGVWICIGLLLYFGYSMMHSVKGRKALLQQQQQQQPAQPPVHEETESQRHQQTNMERATNALTDLTQQSNGQLLPRTASTEFNGGPLQQAPRRPPPPRQESLSKLKRNQERPTNGTADDVKRGLADGSDRRPIYQPRTTGGEMEYQRHQDPDVRLRGGVPAAGNANVIAAEGSVGRNDGTRRGTDPPAQMNIYSRPRPRPGQSKAHQGDHEGWSGGQGQRNDPSSRASSGVWQSGQQSVQYDVYADLWNDNEEEEEAVNYKTSNPFISDEPEPSRRPKNPFRE